jgi:mono/diheme cytochrome c family protein
MMRKRIFQLLGLGILGLVLIQFIPFGHARTNPPAVSEPNWTTPQARAIVKEHCFQCHSNETNWTWYSNIAPGSWLIAFDVIEGRQRFNFSDWNKKPGELDEMVAAIQSGEMPPVQYWIVHPSARMNTQQKQELIHALETSVNNNAALGSGTLR